MDYGDSAGKQFEAYAQLLPRVSLEEVAMEQLVATAGWRATTGVSPSLMAGELERCLLIELLYLILIIILILIKPVYNEHNRVAYPIQYTVNVGTV